MRSSGARGTGAANGGKLSSTNPNQNLFKLLQNPISEGGGLYAVNPNQNLFKLFQNPNSEGGGLYAVLHMCPTLTSTSPSTTTQGDIVRVSPTNITLL